MKEQLAREQGVHGANWNLVHEGYFADPVIAAPLVRAILEAAAEAAPDAVIDLGGGTGFLLGRLRAAGIGAAVTLVNLDDSPLQIGAARPEGFTCLRGSVGSFSRVNAAPDAARCLFVMRSVLHYFGEAGLRPALRQLRRQAREGEFFVHQTASFARREHADALNTLYRMMRTDKWYPTVAALRAGLASEGWRVREVRPAAPLRLSSADLARRYGLAPADIRRIRARLTRGARLPETVFRETADGFTAFLHYRTYVCVAQ